MELLQYVRLLNRKRDLADARLVRPSCRHIRARALSIGIALVLVSALLGAILATEYSPPALASEGGGDLSGGIIGGLDKSVDETIGTSSESFASDGRSIIDEQTTDSSTQLDQDLTLTTGTTAELKRKLASLTDERSELQTLLLSQESRRREAESARDRVGDRLAQRIINLFESGQDRQAQLLSEIRNTEDKQMRSELVKGLSNATDQSLLALQDKSDLDTVKAAELAEATRASILSLGLKITAIDTALKARTGPSQAELARASGKKYTIDADYVFATGPIPSIGYWGAVSGGGMLTGWMGFTSAAVGGTGCEPSDQALKPSGQIESGEASWYGPGFQGNNTASGETFDTNQLTAAHKTLPFGTIVRVYSSATARCVFVRINDRGPYIDGRVIDLSRAAADAIGMESVAPVQLEVYAKN